MNEVCPGSILLAKICQQIFFAILAKEIIEKKLCQKIIYKYSKNRKNNKSNKNQQKKQKPRRTPKCPQISQKSQKQQGFFLPAKNTRDKYRKYCKNNKSNKNQDLETNEATKGPSMSANNAKIAKVTRFFRAS